MLPPPCFTEHSSRSTLHVIQVGISFFFVINVFLHGGFPLTWFLQVFCSYPWALFHFFGIALLVFGRHLFPGKEYQLSSNCRQFVLWCNEHPSLQNPFFSYSTVCLLRISETSFAHMTSSFLKSSQSLSVSMPLGHFIGKGTTNLFSWTETSGSNELFIDPGVLALL